LYLVPKGPAWTVRRKFSQTHQLYCEAWSQTARIAPGRWRTPMSLEFTRGISSRSKHTGKEAIAAVSRRSRGPTDGIFYFPAAKCATENAGGNRPFRSRERSPAIRATGEHAT